MASKRPSSPRRGWAMGFACGSEEEREVQKSGVKSDLRSDVGK